MKGVVFTTFLEMVEEKFGYDTVDEIINSADLPSKGVYTSVGTYSHQEIVALVIELHKKTDIPITDLLRAFGYYLFGVLSSSYKMFFEHTHNSFDFLHGIENYIHVEVKKLYPDAELPRFEVEKINPKQLLMLYYSERQMGHLAYGLIQGCIEYFKEDISIEMTQESENLKKARFLLTLNN